MNYTLKELLDVPRLRGLLGALDELHSMPSAIIDTDGNVLIATAWQDICSKFHRVNSGTEKMCIESDRHIEARLGERTPHVVYKCPMGLVDAAMPIILEGHHLGNVFTGQLFMEAPDEEFFINQARKYGFDEVEYLDAMRKVPFFAEDKLHKNLNFIHGLAQMLAEQGLQRKRLEESRDQHRTILHTTTSGFWIADMQGRILEVNAAFCQMSGYSDDELRTMRISELEASESADNAAKRMKKIMESGGDSYESRHRRKDGSLYDVSVNTKYQPFDGGQCVAFLLDITERKIAEHALRDSQAYNRMLFEQSPVGLALTRFDGLFVDVNQAFAKIIGRTIEETSTLTYWDITPEKYRELEQQQLAGLNSVGVYGPYEKEYIHKEGHYVPVRLQGLIIERNGEKYIWSSVEDVTERKQALDALRESEQNYRSLADSGQLLIWSSGTDKRCPYVNRAWLDFTGRTLEQECGKGWTEGVHPDDMQDCLECYVSAFERRETFSMTYRMLHHDGEYRWLQDDGCPRYDSNGEFIGYIGYCADITERKLAAVALQKSEEQSRNNLQLLQNVIGHFPGVVFWKNAESVYLGCNRNFSDGAGLASPDEIVGKTDFDLPWAKTEASHYRDIDRSVIDSGEAALHVIETQRQAGGNTLWFDTCKIPLQNENGTIYGVLGVSTDITLLKEHERERQQLAQQFHQAQKLESLGVLAGGIAHDFNNILAIIMGNCSLAELDSAKAENYIPPIQIAAERAAGLCRQMLTYAGKAETVMGPVRMPVLVEEMVAMLRATIRHNAVLQCDCFADIPIITGDASQIRQIVMNLIINASEAIGDLQGLIQVSLATAVVKTATEKDVLGAVLPVGVYACLVVADNGCGMDEETQSRIFEPFYTTKFAGRGLGMSAVLGIVTAHKGALQLISQLGSGSTFKLYLPIGIGSHVVEAALKKASPECWQGAGTILLVEDEESIMWVAKAMLSRVGFSVIEAVNGKDALEAYRQHSADITLVITDIGMPVMDGYELFRELKKLNPALPIVISSGFGETVVTSRISKEEMAGFVTKPYGFEELRKVLTIVLAKTRS